MVTTAVVKNAGEWLVGNPYHHGFSVLYYLFLF